MEHQADLVMSESIVNASRLDELADEFSSVLENGGLPDISSFVARADSTIKDRLREELVQVAGEFCNDTDTFVQTRYQIVSRLGEGAFAQVFLGVDTLLKRYIAIKIPKERITAWGDMNELHIRESRIQSRVEHPSIADLYGTWNLPNGHYCIVTEYVHGLNLREYADAKSPTIADKLRIVKQVADGLHAAHNAEIVHRDVKPENIIVTGSLRAKLIDFGLARSLDEKSLAESFVGTVGYASPEQIDRSEIDYRSDIYSLGVVLYELLVGERPSRSRLVRPRRINKSIPRAVDAVCMRALQPRPSSRFETAKEFSNAIALAIHGKHSRRTNRATLFATCAIALIALLAFVFWGPRDKKPQVNAHLPPKPVPKYAVRITTNPPNAYVAVVPVLKGGIPSKKIMKLGLSPASCRLEAGTYFVRAIHPKTGHSAEVIRQFDPAAQMGIFPHNRWARDGGEILLSTVPLVGVDRSQMQRFPGRSNRFMDITPVTVDAFNAILPHNKPTSTGASVTGITFGLALLFAEKSGKRLPFSFELALFKRSNIDEWAMDYDHTPRRRTVVNTKGKPRPVGVGRTDEKLGFRCVKPELTIEMLKPDNEQRPDLTQSSAHQSE